MQLTMWDDASCQRIHEATLTVLDKTGIAVNYAPAREIFRQAGAAVDGTRVRIPGELVATALKSAPKSWQIKPRGGPTAPLVLDASHSYFGTGSDLLYIADPDTHERRRVVKDDIEGLAALCEQLASIDFVMSMGLPADVPHEIDDLAQVDAMLRGTRKPFVVAPRDGSVIRAMQEMCTVAGERESLAAYAMPSPPLMIDADGASKVIACAELGVPLVWAPAPNAGTTAPASIVAVIVVGNAETLAGLVLQQAVKPGAPFVWGVGVGALNMHTMVDVYSSANVFSGHQAQTDLARWYGLPSFAYAGHSDAKVLDQQWSAETAMTTILGALSQATLLHDVGYLESGLQGSYESVLLGDHLIGYARAFMADLIITEETLALDEIQAVGPGGNHLARPYTRHHFRHIWQSDLFDSAVYEHWRQEGAMTLLDRLRARVALLRAAPRTFTLSAAVRTKLEDIVARAGASRAA